jgi:hypothetical protein
MLGLPNKKIGVQVYSFTDFVLGLSNKKIGVQVYSFTDFVLVLAGHGKMRPAMSCRVLTAA